MRILVVVYPGRAPARNAVRGFSLVELMVAMVLGIFLIGAVIVTFVSGRAASTDAEILSRMQENARIVSEHLIRDLRNAGFQDELSLTFGRVGLLNREFAAFGKDGEELGTELKIRYSGRGHCGERFDRFVVVENRYYVEDGELRCDGRHIPHDTPDISGNDEWDDRLGSGETVTIISGVSGILFQKLPNGCEFSLENMSDACVGVHVTIDFDGLRSGVGVETRTLELRAAFRNVVVERMNRNIP